MLNLRKKTDRLTSDSGFTLVELLVVIAIIGVLVALLLPAVQAAREASRRMSCLNKERQIMIGLHNYESSMNEFPAGSLFDLNQNAAGENNPGANAISWLIQIMPYMEQATISDQVGNAIRVEDIPASVRGPLLSANIEMFWCPSHPKNEVEEDYTDPNHGLTTYNGVTGGPLIDQNGDPVEINGKNGFSKLETGHRLQHSQICVGCDKLNA